MFDTPHAMHAHPADAADLTIARILIMRAAVLSYAPAPELEYIHAAEEIQPQTRGARTRRRPQGSQVLRHRRLSRVVAAAAARRHPHLSRTRAGAAVRRRAEVGRGAAQGLSHRERRRSRTPHRIDPSSGRLRAGARADCPELSGMAAAAAPGRRAAAAALPRRRRKSAQLGRTAAYRRALRHPLRAGPGRASAETVALRLPRGRGRRRGGDAGAAAATGTAARATATIRLPIARR